MKRCEKYPDTNYFTYYNANPHNRIAADCVIRAICTHLNQTWEDTVNDLTKIGIKYGLVLNEKACYEKYLKNKGYIKQKQPRHVDNTRYTVKQFIDENPDITCIAKIGSHHIAAIRKGKVLDIWNSSNCIINNYWI